MPSLIASLFAAGLATLAQAYTAPGAQTWGPLLTPDTSNAVTQGKDFTVTWDPEDHPTDGVTVSLVLCHGPSTNCVLSDTAIASGIPAAQKSFDWKVPCDLAPGTEGTDTGYGMLIIVDGTGEFQYSTQFSCLENKSCSSSSSSSSSPVISISASASASGTVTVSGGSTILLGPPAYQTGSYTWGSSGNSTWATTVSATGSSWATATASSTGLFTYSSGYYSTLPGTTVIASSTLSTAAAGTTVAAQSSGATSAPAASASTFAGGAGQVSYSAAGLIIAGAVAVLAL